MKATKLQYDACGNGLEVGAVVSICTMPHFGRYATIERFSKGGREFPTRVVVRLHIADEIHSFLSSQLRRVDA